MATVSRDIALNVVASIDDFRKELAKMPGVTEKQAAASARRMVAQFAKAETEAARSAQKGGEKSGKAFGEAFTRIASAAALAGAARAVLGFQQQIADSVNEVNDLSARTGIAAETLNGLRLAAQSSGQDIGNLEGALQKVPKLMGDVAKGSTEAENRFKALGVEVFNADGTFRDADSVLRDTLGTIQSIEDPTTRAAAAAQVFEESGGRLLQALGDKSLRDFVTLSNEFGVNVGPRAAAAAAQWQQSTTELSNVLLGTGQGLLTFLNAGPKLDNFTIGFLYLREVATEALREISDRFLATFTAIDMALRRDFRGAIRQANDAMAPYAMSLSDINERAMETTNAFIAARSAARGVSDTVTDGAPAMTDYAQALRGAAGASRDLGDATARVREETQAAADAVTSIIESGYSAEQKAASKLREQLIAITEARRLGAVTAREAAQAEAIAQQEYDDVIAKISEDRAKREADDHDRRRREIEEITAARHAQTQAELQAAAATMSAFVDVSGAIAGTLRDGSQAQSAVLGFQRAFAITSSLISVAQGVAAALAQGPIGLAQIAPIAAAGAAAIGTIRSASAPAPPTFHTGGSPDEINATIRRNESVLTRTGVHSLGGDDAIKRANRGDASPQSLVVPMIYRGRVIETVMAEQVRGSSSVRRSLRTVQPGRKVRT